MNSQSVATDFTSGLASAIHCRVVKRNRRRRLQEIHEVTITYRAGVTPKKYWARGTGCSPEAGLQIDDAWRNAHDRLIHCTLLWIDWGHSAVDRGRLPYRASSPGTCCGASSKSASNSRGFCFWSHGLADRFYVLWSRISLRR